MKLRPHQERAITLTRESFKKGHKHICLACCVASGKTLIAKNIIDSALSKGRSVGFFSFRKILIKQMKNYFGENPNITIGTIQKYGKQNVDVDLAIFDEKDFHDAKLKNNIKSKFSITLSGTPMGGLGNALEFDDIIDVIQIPDLIELGLAKPIKVIGNNIVDTTNLKRNKSDFLPKESYDLMSSSSIQKDMISIYKKHCLDRKTIMFAMVFQTFFITFFKYC